jgi:LPXTG-motif cell wall-anchored protein
MSNRHQRARGPASSTGRIRIGAAAVVSAALIAGAALGATPASAATPRSVALTLLDSVQPAGTARSITPVAVDTATLRAYVGDIQARLLHVYDVSGSVFVDTGKTVPIPKDSFALAINETTEELLITDDGLDTVTVIDVDPASPTAYTVLATIPVGAYEPQELAIDESSDTAYVVDDLSSTVTVIDIASRSVRKQLTAGIGRFPTDVVVDPVTHAAYVSSAADSSISVIAGDVVRATHSVRESPVSLGMAGGRLLAGTATPTAAPTDFEVESYDTDTFAVLQQSTALTEAPLQIGTDPSLNLVYVRMQSGAVKALRLDALTDEGPDSLISPRTAASIFVDAGTHRVYDEASNATAAFVGMYTSAVSPLIPPFTPPPGQIGVPYDYAVPVIAWPAANFDSVGDLPAGLRIDPSSGHIVGTPTARGGTFKVSATNSAGTTFSESTGIDIALPPAVAPIIETGALPGATLGTAYDFVLTASGTPQADFIVTSGSLPADLQLFADGSIVGTPTTSGTFTVTITARNSVGSDSKTYVLVVSSSTGGATSASGASTVTARPTGTLANTGVGSQQFGMTGGVAIFLTLVGGALLFLRRRRHAS